MKKILTIAATALLSTIAGAAHAQTTATVSFGGAITSSCSITASTNGALVQSGNSLITASTPTGSATAKVVCNGNNTLAIAVNPGSPTKLYGGTAVTGFNGGDGVYSEASGVSTTTTAPTTAAGDTAKINVVVTAPTGQLLPAKLDYNVVVDVTLTAL